MLEKCRICGRYTILYARNICQKCYNDKNKPYKKILDDDAFIYQMAVKDNHFVGFASAKSKEELKEKMKKYKAKGYGKMWVSRYIQRGE